MINSSRPLFARYHLFDVEADKGIRKMTIFAEL